MVWSNGNQCPSGMTPDAASVQQPGEVMYDRQETHNFH